MKIVLTTAPRAEGDLERGRIEEFARKIQILLSNKDIYDKFREEELRKVKEYSLEKVVNQFVKLFC